MRAHRRLERLHELVVVGMDGREPVEGIELVLGHAPEIALRLVQVDAAPVLVAHPQHDRRVFGDEAEPLLALAQGGLVALLLGDVMPLEEDARGGAVGDDRLVDEIEIALVDRPARTMLQLELRVAADKRLAGPVDLVEQSDKALRRHLGHGFADRLSQYFPMADQRAVGLIHHGELMFGAAGDGDEARRLLEHAAQALAFRVELALGAYLVGGLDHDRHHAGRLARLVKQRRVVEVQPHLLRRAVAIKREHLIPIGERAAGEADLHDVVVEVGDLGPPLAHLGPEQVGMAAAREGGIGIIVDHDAVLAPQRDDRHRRTEDKRDRGFQARAASPQSAPARSTASRSPQ